ncbi:hypothetical protein [Stakelama tenebrarum]|uniref:Uncharacterized protein n=1 Tax=Stakelama tenebrarum TaxID=2711215 RepID=A0A6G6Y6C9_9SPHN|nr:hypothetical protein [Sphingosinithalassobacter tenebrarum]QIG80136.1 hypothetical protein G5C33_10325 [Sphingosinithalassobacter tenebrarum]
MTDQRDLTGVWYGRYEAELWDEKNGFIAHLEELGGAVNGTITERDTTGAVAIRRAEVHGTRSGATVQFVKQYDGTGGHVHAIRYSGRVDDEGTRITGGWQIAWARGSFTMEREKFDADLLEAEDAEEVAAPVAMRP